MDAVAVRPGKPEHAHWDQDGTNKTRGQTSLRRCRSIVGRSNAHVPLVVKHASNDSTSHTNCDTDESQAADTSAPALVLLEDDGEGCEAEIQSTVDDGHVDGSQENNGLHEEEDPWSEQGNLELRADSLVRLAKVQLGDVHLAGPLGQSSSAALKKDRGIGLGVGQGADDPENAVEDGNHAHDPTPALIFAKEATSNRT